MRQSIEQGPDRSNQFVVQPFKMRFRGALHGLDESLRIRRTHAKFGKLEAQELQNILDP